MNSLTSTWDVAVWVAGFAVVWALASVPAYWFLRAWLEIKQSVDAAFGSLLSIIRRGRETRAASMLTLRKELAERTNVFEVEESAVTAWRETLKKMLGAVSTASTQIQVTRAAALKRMRQLERESRRVRSVRLVSAVVPRIPTVDSALLSAKQNRVASLNFVLAVFFLIPIAAANAQFTGLVLSELIGPVQPMFGVPIPYVIAFVIVMAEMVIGLLHAAEAETREGSERRLTVAGLIWSMLGITVVVIEALLYAQLQPGSDRLKLPIGGSALGLVGAVLGAAVFGLGRMAYSSAATFRRERTAKSLAKHLHNLRDAADEWNLAAQKLKPTQEEAADRYDRLLQLCRDASTAQSESTHQFNRELEGYRDHAPPWAEPKVRALTPAEFGEREARVSLWLVIAVIASVGLALLCTQLAVRMDWVGATGLGLGLAAAAFAAGAFGTQNAPNRTAWRVVFYSLLFGVVVVLVLGSSRILRGRLSFHSVLVLVPVAAAFLAGLQIGRLVSLTAVPLTWVFHRVTELILFLGLAIVWLVSFGTSLIEHAARVIASPTTVIAKAIGSRRQVTQNAPLA